MLRKDYCLIITLIVHLLTFNTTMSQVYLLLGSNLGNRKIILGKAIELINSQIGSVIEVSSIYESEPWGFISNKRFLNQVIIVETTYQPLETLNKLQQIEKGLGRKLNSPAYQNRFIDIDILFFDDIQMESKELTIPHPRLHLRDFTMVPLIEIAADYIHPVFALSLNMLSLQNHDNNSVKVVARSKTPFTLKSNEV